MTHYHYSTLGNRLVSLAKQGITYPLRRVLRFIEAGATVPNSNSLFLSLPKSLEGVARSPKSIHDKVKTKNMAKIYLPIQSGVIKASLTRAQDCLQQINSIIAPSYLQTDLNKQQEINQLQLIKLNSAQEVVKKSTQLQKLSSSSILMMSDITGTLQRLSDALTEQANYFSPLDDDPQVELELYQKTHIFLEFPKSNVSLNHAPQYNCFTEFSAQHYQPSTRELLKKRIHTQYIGNFAQQDVPTDEFTKDIEQISSISSH